MLLPFSWRFSYSCQIFSCFERLGAVFSFFQCCSHNYRMASIGNVANHKHIICNWSFYIRLQIVQHPYNKV